MFLTATFATAAALAFLFYMANGIAVGALIGLPGRASEVAAAQHHAAIWLGISAVFQVGVVVGLFSMLRFGADADRIVRYVSRSIAAVFLSLPTTLLIGVVLFEIISLLRPHLR